jgi:hypothetical protein
MPGYLSIRFGNARDDACFLAAALALDYYFHRVGKLQVGDF